MKLFWWYTFFMYAASILVGFFGLLNSIAPCVVWEYLPDFWISLILIIGGAIGFELSTHIYYKVKKIENAKQHR